MTVSDTMLRGSKIRIWPTKRQAQQMDLWRRRTTSLWNLLLELEQAAYSGENRKSRLGWRSIWARVLEESHEANRRAWETGKKVRMGKNKGQTIPPRTGPEPEPPDPSMIGKITRQSFDIDAETGEVLPARLFMWEHELHKVMARLKKVPRTEWIADLPSHASQAVVKDLIRALQNMLRERKKRASGEGGRDTGFPKFKKSRYASGSVYFANTQLGFDFEKNKVKLPNGCGWMKCELPDTVRFATKVKLMGGRIWRQGEEWFLSCQWELPRPAPLEETGHSAGVKIAAGILLTTYDERGQTREFTMPPVDEKLVRQHRRAGIKLARSMQAQKRRQQKKLASGYSERRQRRLASRDATSKPLRTRRPKAFFEASARLAKLEAAQRDARDDFLHKLTTRVVQRFDTISVQKMDVAKLMKKPSAKNVRRRRKKLEQAGEATQPRRNLRAVRKLMRHVAMARCRQMLEYKMKDLRGPEAFVEVEALEQALPDIQTCSRCEHINPQMKDGRAFLRCENCGFVLRRNRNAARNARKRILDSTEQG